jgi:DNA-binding response OmpR family regulator
MRVRVGTQGGKIVRIAVVDDDTDFSASLADLLTGAGHSVVVSANGSAFLRLAKTETFDLILLDWNLPGLDGLAILRNLRTEVMSDVPVILLTLRTEATDVVAGLEAGADDYVSKPVDGRILVARIDAIMRRRHGGRTNEAVQVFGDFVFDSTQEIVRRGETSMQLTAKEFQLAMMLFRNISRPLSRAYLLEAVWNRNPDVQTRTLDSHVARLRLKLGLRPQNGWRLSPIYSYGYRLEPVEGGAELADHVQ